MSPLGLPPLTANTAVLGSKTLAQHSLSNFCIRLLADMDPLSAWLNNSTFNLVVDVCGEPRATTYHGRLALANLLCKAT